MFTMILKTKKQKPKNTTGVFCVVCFGFWGVWGGRWGVGLFGFFFSHEVRKSSEFMMYFQSKPSYSTSFHNAIWKNLFRTAERSLCCPCQLSEHINSPPPDFKADACSHDTKAPAVCSQRLPRICLLCAQSQGILADPSRSQAAAEPQE